MNSKCSISKAWRLFVMIGVAVLTLGVMTSVVLAKPAYKAYKGGVIQDVLDGSGEARDSVGPTGFGFVNANQNSDGDLRIVFKLEGAAANATYGVRLWCGPKHVGAFPLVADFGNVVVTDDKGNGNSGAQKVPVATLQAKCGSGQTSSHVDLDNVDTTGTYLSQPLEYYIPLP